VDIIHWIKYLLLAYLAQKWPARVHYTMGAGMIQLCTFHNLSPSHQSSWLCISMCSILLVGWRHGGLAYKGRGITGPPWHGSEGVPMATYGHKAYVALNPMCMVR